MHIWPHIPIYFLSLCHRSLDHMNTRYNLFDIILLGSNRVGYWDQRICMKLPIAKLSNTSFRMLLLTVLLLFLHTRNVLYAYPVLCYSLYYVNTKEIYEGIEILYETFTSKKYKGKECGPTFKLELIWIGIEKFKL